ncbi:MAG: hypothetical protein SV765_09425 [Pseudomonadota bacterium]|nr:hypothetical protein [Pseudomonadales bacterium]MDY6920418.1 hypothetical protein [Pseudomonadota bacterium]
MSNDSLGDLSMKPTRDELVQRQHSRGKPAPKQPTRPPSGPRWPGQASLGGVWSVLIVVIVCGAAGGWYLWDNLERLQSSLAQSTQALADAERSLSGLQQKLENRDNTLSKSGDQMLADIKLLDSEVRKLWDLSNKRNRPNIEELTRQTKALKSDLQGLSGKLDSMSRKVTSSSEQLATLQRQVNDMQESNATLAQTANGLKQDVKDLRATVGSAADLDDRLTSVEVAIKAIDAHRSQVNGQLQRLDRELGQLLQGSTGP